MLQGRCAIFSIQDNKTRVGTIELSLPNKKVAQLRARYNTRIDNKYEIYIKRWAQENGISFRSLDV